MLENYDFKKTEREMQKFWKENQIYQFETGQPKDEVKEKKPIFSIDTPPPTVSGSLHIGHIFSYTQAEMIARFKRMQGYNVFYPFGFDDNGLPTERLVEREENIRANELPRSEFNKRCLTITDKYIKEFKELWMSLGFSVDWNLQYETISPIAQKISQKSFMKLLKDGKAYMKESPVLWCTECQTSIAQAELDTVDKEAFFHYIPFETDEESLSVATTRPELLYGCDCLFVHPEDQRYQKYIGKMVKVPLYDYEIPILTDEKVSIDKGTGIVMCATFGDSTDAEWFEKHHLAYRKIILPDGKIESSVPYIGGLRVTAARKKIIELLSEQGLLIKSESITHSVAVHERCGKEIEIIPSRQWYIDILSNKERFLKAADEINWYPSHMKNRYLLWVENLKWDWCISRQRYFGVPFPIWYCKNCNEVIMADEDQLPVNPLENKPKKSCKCGCTEFIPELSVFDTWATSSVSPFINSKWEEAGELTDELLPMSMRTQAHEIIRTWAFYTIVKSLYHIGKLPWKDIMICGFVLAKKGEKISKSKNNSELSPSALIENHSADALRYWAANSKLGTDTFFSTDELKIAKRFLNKLWNAAKFSLSHLQDIDMEENMVKDKSYDNNSSDKEAFLSANIGLNKEIEMMTSDLLPVDRFIIERSREVTKEAVKLLEQYEIGSARHVIDDFFWKDFCDNYLEIVKERLYQPDKHGVIERKSAQKALYYSMLTVLKLYSIYVPHITEYIYQDFFKKYEKSQSLHQLCFDKIDEIDRDILDFGERLKDTIAEVRKYKSEHNLSMKSEINEVVIKAEGRQLEWFRLMIGDLKACCSAKEIRIE